MEKKFDIKILLVDDRMENLLALEAVLENENYNLVKATSGRQALRYLEDGMDFYLIIMDVVMPEMDGFETAKLIYSREKFRNIPIIFLTAMDIEGNIYKGYKSGGVDYIKKPVVPELLRVKVSAFVEFSIINKMLISKEEELRMINKNLENEVKERKRSEEKINSLNKALQQKLEELQSLDAFSYSVSHDLMSPLKQINGLADLFIKLYGDKLNEDGQEILSLIVESTKNMSQFIKNLLHFSKQTSGELKKTDLDMNETVNTILDEIAVSKPLDHVEINITKMPNAYCDKEMIKHVWLNFISNAIKYSAKKKNPKVNIGSLKENDLTVYYVKDNGAGFDMKDYNKLFGLFQRLHDSSDFEGTGVGLAIVKRIVERHGGKVWAESEKEKGSTFYFSV